MTIPAGMLDETIDFISNDGSTRFKRKGRVNSYGQTQDTPEFSDYQFNATIRYDSETKTITDKWSCVWDGYLYQVESVSIRKTDRLIDIRGGSRRENN